MGKLREEVFKSQPCRFGLKQTAAIGRNMYKHMFQLPVQVILHVLLLFPQLNSVTASPDR